MPRQKNGPEADIADLRRQITGLVAHNAVAMVQRAIDGVMEEGQYQAIKYLFEMVGLYPPTAEEGEVPEDSLAKVLLDRLGIEAGEASGGAESVDEGHPVK